MYGYVESAVGILLYVYTYLSVLSSLFAKLNYFESVYIDGMYSNAGC